MKKIDKRTKREQFFVLMLLCIGAFTFFCISGCSGQSCEKVSCEREKLDGGEIKGCSIPGCGGCFTSGKGCNSCLWPQSCKWISGKAVDEESETKGSVKISGCDIRYFGDGCLGCGQEEKSCYAGCMNSQSDGAEVNGFVYGSTDKGEYTIGEDNGESGCVNSYGQGLKMLQKLEEKMGIK